MEACWQRGQPVEGLVNAGKLPPGDGQALIDTAQSIIDQLSV